MNGGFTLLELIISIAILSVVMTAALAFMQGGAFQFARINGRIDLQYAAQQALSHIGQEVIDTDAGMVYEPEAKADGSSGDTSYLMLVDRVVTGSTVTYSVRTYVLDGEKVYYNEADYSDSLPTDTGAVKQDAIDAGHVLADHVTAFSFKPYAVDSTSDAGTKQIVRSMRLEITMEYRKQSYTGTQVTSLRNEVLHAETLPDLESALNPPEPATP